MYTKYNKLINLVILLAISFSSWAVDTHKLELISALPIDGVDDFQPSGMTTCNGKLLVVSDKHNEIYVINEDKDSVKAKVFLTLKEVSAEPDQDLPTIQAITRWLDFLVRGKHYDWEGITCDVQNRIVALSESYSSIANINSDGQIEWIPVRIFDTAHKAGMLNKYNVGFEGIAWHKDKLYVVAERQDRGFVEIELTSSKWEVVLAKTNIDRQLQDTVNSSRQEDFTGLFSDGDWIYTLERNASALCSRNGVSFELIECWSYLDTETSPEYVYSDAEFGLGEGVTIKDGYVYIVMDNNGYSRNKKANDTRPLLLKFTFNKKN